MQLHVRRYNSWDCHRHDSRHAVDHMADIYDPRLVEYSQRRVNGGPEKAAVVVPWFEEGKSFDICL